MLEMKGRCQWLGHQATPGPGLSDATVHLWSWQEEPGTAGPGLAGTGGCGQAPVMTATTKDLTGPAPGSRGEPGS